MSANATPLLLGGMALFLLSRRGDDEGSKAPALTEPDPPMAFSCEELPYVWHESVDGNLPLTIAAYETAYEYMQKRFMDSNGADANQRDYTLDALELIATGCHWEDQMKYSERMVEVYNAMQTIYDEVTAGLTGGQEGQP